MPASCIGDGMTALGALSVTAADGRTERSARRRALRARQLQSAVDTHAMICAEVASRAGRDADDFEVHTFAAAVIGVMIPAIIR
jgi:MftR C-terminal domain